MRESNSSILQLNLEGARSRRGCVAQGSGCQQPRWIDASKRFGGSEFKLHTVALPRWRSQAEAEILLSILETWKFSVIYDGLFTKNTPGFARNGNRVYSQSHHLSMILRRRDRSFTV